jgi:hypothetical protein
MNLLAIIQKQLHASNEIHKFKNILLVHSHRVQKKLRLILYIY